MRRKLKYICRIFYNYIRRPVLFVLNCGHIRMSGLQLIAPGVKLLSEKNGAIEVKGSNIESGTLIHSAGGKINIKNAFINRNCTVVSMDNIVIEDGVTIGPGVCIYDHDHSLDKNHKDPYVKAGVKIQKGAWIGANAVILKGVTIGKNAVVAAGAVVTKNVPDFSIVGGVPAKVINKCHE